MRIYLSYWIIFIRLRCRVFKIFLEVHFKQIFIRNNWYNPYSNIYSHLKAKILFLLNIIYWLRGAVFLFDSAPQSNTLFQILFLKRDAKIFTFVI